MNITYDKSISGIYYHSQRISYNKFRYNKIRVEILGETNNSYRVKLLEPTLQRRSGDIVSSRKKSVYFQYYNENDKKCILYNFPVENYHCENCKVIKCSRQKNIKRRLW